VNGFTNNQFIMNSDLAIIEIKIYQNWSWRVF